MGGFYRRVGDELNLYVRQLAWLHAAPEPENKAVDAKTVLPRIEQYQAAGKVVSLPPVSAPHLAQYLMEIGPFVSTGMGEAPIGWRDIEAWQNLTGTDLEPWEARIVYSLSRAYISQSSKSRKDDCPAPYLTAEDMVANREAAAEQVALAFRAAVQSAQQ